MKLCPIPLLLLLAACAAHDDDLAEPLPPSGGSNSATNAEPDESARVALLAPVWSSTEFGQASFLNVGQLDFGPDGSLVVGSTLDDRPTSNDSPVGRVDRFARDGRRLWTTKLSFDDFAGDLPLNDGDDIRSQWLRLASIDHRADGTVLVAFGIGVDYADRGADLLSVSTRNYIRSYDASGNLLGTIRLGGVSRFPVQDSVDDLFRLNHIRALPDGSIAWTGMTFRGPHPASEEIPVVTGSIGRLSAAGEPLWTLTVGQELDFRRMIAPPEEVALDLQPTLDGDLMLSGHFHGVLTIGDFRAEFDGKGSYFARVGLDGTPTRLATLNDSEPLGSNVGFPGMGMDTNGHIFASSYFFEGNVQRLIEIDRDGTIVTGADLGAIESLTVAGDHIATGGSVGLQVDDGFASPARIEVREPDGTVVASRVLAPARIKPGMEGHVFTIAASDDGRHIAVGGTFRGAVDLGQGPVGQPMGVQIAAYVAVFRAPIDAD